MSGDFPMLDFKDGLQMCDLEHMKNWHICDIFLIKHHASVGEHCIRNDEK